MSGRSARTIRNFSLELWQDLVLLDIRKSTFQHLTVNWNLNVLEMSLNTLRFVQGLSRTPLFFFPRYLTTRFCKMILQKQKNLENRTSENLEIPKPRFTNKCPAKASQQFPEPPTARTAGPPILKSDSPSNSLIPGLLLVNLGFWIFRFPDCGFSRFFIFGTYFWKICW